MKTSGRLRKKAVYGPLSQQTLEAVLKRELLTNFGFENMGVVADVLIQRFLAIIEEYAPSQKKLRPYQTLVLAVNKHERFGYGKRMEQCKLVPVILNLVTPEELQELADGSKMQELRPRIAARILKEAYEQGGVLSFSTVGLLIGLHSVTAVSNAVVLFYEQNPDEVLPHSGTIFDMGRTLTHKKASVLLKHQGLLEKEIARRINHHPSNVARYNNDDERVGRLLEEGKSVEMISFITGLSMSVAQEYIDIRQEMQQQTGKET
ncbi:MAG: DUF1670 domain-containing protein [Anaerolineales bacterium]|nr:DUF1670 domain-containing protein [Anaerolineales bacterium]